MEIENLHANEWMNKNSPIVSIVIPLYNHLESLPRALTSILGQTYKNIEVIIVDDCSDLPCTSITEEYRLKGLDITVIQLSFRHYTKNARLRGVEASSGSILAFLDADDVYIDEMHLERHVCVMEKHDADVVQFRTVCIDENGSPYAPYSLVDPPLGIWEGTDILDAVTETPGGQKLYLTMWNKLWKKDLFLKIIPIAKPCAIRRYAEDTFINLLLFCVARRYVGSPYVGYGHYFVNKGPEKAPESIINTYLTLKIFVPFMNKEGIPVQLKNKCIYLLMKKYLLHIKTAFVVNKNQFAPEKNILEKFDSHFAKETVIEALSAGYLIQQQINNYKQPANKAILIPINVQIQNAVIKSTLAYKTFILLAGRFLGPGAKRNAVNNPTLYLTTARHPVPRLLRWAVRNHMSHTSD